MRRRTWAPRGQTPIHRAWDRHDRLSAILALSISPQRRRFGTYFQIHCTNIRTEEVVGFLWALHYQLRRKIILVWDRWSVHRAAATWMQEVHPDWFDFE